MIADPRRDRRRIGMLDPRRGTAREDILRSDMGWSQEKWESFAEMGLLGLPFAEEYDGADMGFAEVAVVMEEFGRALVLEPYLSTVVLGAGFVDAAGSAEQKQEILPAVIAGEATSKQGDEWHVVGGRDPLGIARAQPAHDRAQHVGRHRSDSE